MTKFQYWKKIYLLLGSEFELNTWKYLDDDGYDSLFGHPSSDNEEYVKLIRRRKVEFTPLFYKELEND